MPTPPSRVKTSRRSRFAGRLAGHLLDGLGRTLDLQLDDRFGLQHHPQPVLLLLWHDEVLLAPVSWQAHFPHHPLTALTSASRDGAKLAEVLHHFGIQHVRGSSSRRGAAALLGLRRAARQGSSLVITPDGPKGPRHHLKPGALHLAQTTGLPLVGAHLSGPAWTLPTWDRLRLPKPWQPARLTLWPLPPLSATLPPEDFERQRQHIQTSLQNPPQP